MPSPNTTTFAASSLMTSYQVGKLLQVNPSSVNKWIKDGRIPAYRTPGGHRRIRATDLLTFLTSHKMPIPQGLKIAPKTRSVLAISDEPRALEGLRLPDFAGLGLDISFAKDGLDGLMRVGTDMPDVVVLGPIKAPLETLDVCQRLRTQAKTAAVKIAVVVPPLGSISEEQAKKAGANWILNAPLSKDALLAVVQSPV